MCPFTTLPPGEGPSRFSPTAVKDWQPRRKEHREALEGRIHQLEAQLAAHVNAPMHGMESIDQNVLAATPTSFDWQTPPPHLDLDTTIPATFTADDLDLGSFSAGGSLPSISIDQCEHVPNVASPNSDVPSFWSGTTRASSPEMPPTSAPAQFASISQHISDNKSFASPMQPHTAPSWEFMAQASSGQLKPETGSSRGHSRRTSATSLSADSDENAMSPIPEVEDDLLPLAPAPRLPRQGIFAPSHAESPTPGSSRSSFTDRSRALATTPLPSRFEAETLTTEFVQYVESLQYQAYNMSPQLFARLCENVYPNPQRASSATEMSVSIPMARFHVFLAMAIAMKLRIRESPEMTNALLDTCYELAMQQTSVSTFWQENGGVEAAQLLSIFATIRRTTSSEPRPLQQSFSW
ncbi:hypothetical protein BKA63DRAFT_580918 [Paraphoma chrysanthemicola]|nr:hypothetical protein BKA63DRAFT_580918 [Paraphoma chrysanthemicola]